MATASVNTITARALLSGFLELRRLCPDLTDWTEEHLAGNPPRLFRLRRLAALFRAFGIPWNPRSFVEGEFIQPEHPRYDSLLSQLTTEMPKHASRGVGMYRAQLPQFFAILFDYRKRVDDVLSFSSGVMEASGLYLQAHRKAGELNRIIEDHVAIIEGTLAALISPEAAVFSVEQLVRDYGYPDQNLSEIDEDWF